MGPASVALLWLALAGPGRAAEGDARGGAPAEQARLEQAVAEYQSGRWDAAQLALTVLISDPSVTQSVQQEARIYLGEVVYTRGDEEGARKIFEQVLAIDPDFQVDPFRHPPEILTQFEIARSSVSPFPRPEPFRAKFAETLVPAGWYQLRYGRPAKGTTFLIAQTGLTAVSLTMWISLLPDVERRYNVGSLEERSAQQRTTVQLITGWAAAGTYLWGFLDAQNQWRAERNRNLAADLPIGLTIHGRL
jgi:hypothetical protein